MPRIDLLENVGGAAENGKALRDKGRRDLKGGVSRGATRPIEQIDLAPPRVKASPSPLVRESDSTAPLDKTAVRIAGPEAVTSFVERAGIADPSIGGEVLGGPDITIPLGLLSDLATSGHLSKKLARTVLKAKQSGEDLAKQLAIKVPAKEEVKADNEKSEESQESSSVQPVS